MVKYNILNNIDDFDFSNFKYIKSVKGWDIDDILKVSWFFAVASDKNKNIGFLNVKEKVEDIICNIQFLEIADSYKRERVGTKLIELSIKELKKRGVKEVSVYDDTKHNFFANLGFKYKDKVFTGEVYRIKRI